MITHCKVCGEQVPEDKPHRPLEDFWCQKCLNYSFVLMENGQVESETLIVGNYMLCFFPHFKSATIVERAKGLECKKLKNIELEELNQENVQYWLKKLKTYVIFQ